MRTLRVDEMLLSVCVLHVLLLARETFQQAPVLISAPRFLPDKEEIVLSAGTSDFLLRCEGESQIVWKTDKFENSDFGEDKRFSVRSELQGNLHLSELSLDHPNYTDTKYYYCYYKYHPNLVSKIYVYVEDTDVLVAEKDVPLVSVKGQGEDVTLPCRPNSPKYSVTLWNGHGYEVTGPNVHYDPKSGFLIEDLSDEYSGYFSCSVYFAGKTTNLTFMLTVYRSNIPLEKPYIAGSDAIHAILGGQFILNCSLTYSMGQYIQLEWESPNPHFRNAIEMERIIIIGPTMGDRSNSQHKTALIDIVVQDVQQEDEGTYTCRATEQSSQSQSSKFVQVFDSGTSFIEMKLDTNRTEARAGAKEVQWVVQINAYPHPTLMWYRNGDVLENGTKYSVINDLSNKLSILKIHNIDMRDTGKYTLRGTAGREKKEVDLLLVVIDKPAVLVQNISSFYFTHRYPYRFKCIARGYPTPTIEWMFQGCPTMNTCDPSFRPVTVLKANAASINKPRPKSDDEVISTLSVTAQKSGFYKCRAANVLGEGDQVFPFFITDVPDGVLLNASDLHPVDKDSVVLQCSASIYNYTSQISWFWIPERRWDEVKLDNTTGFQITKDSTPYSHFSRIEHPSIGINNSGKYICRLDPMQDMVATIHEESMAVTVRKIVPPKFSSESSMNGGEIIVKQGDSIKLNCTVTGVPTPEVTWYKDGQELILTLNDSKKAYENSKQVISFLWTLKNEDDGTYSCVAYNKGGKIKQSAVIRVDADEEQEFINRKEVIITISVVSIGVLICVGLIGFLIRTVMIERKKRKEFFSKKEVKQFVEGNTEGIPNNPEVNLEDKAEFLPYNAGKWEFPKERLKFLGTLGKGTFGLVMKAEAIGILGNDSKTLVAVKRVKDHAEKAHRVALASELKIMSYLGHHVNIVNLLGACTKDMHKEEIFVIVEYCRFGSLEYYLQNHRKEFIDQIDPNTGDVDFSITERRDTQPYERALKYVKLDGSVSSDEVELTSSGYLVATPSPFVTEMQRTFSVGSTMSNVSSGNDALFAPWASRYKEDSKKNEVKKPITTSDLIIWSWQVARGMEYLANQKIIHRDLAARNILLAENNIVKVGDFGLARDVYHKAYHTKGDVPLPVKWMAMESIFQDMICTSKSDVWSFGITMWEIFSLGSAPYPGLNGKDLISKLKQGYRMEKPKYATQNLHDVMSVCWLEDPDHRPSFADLVVKMGSMVDARVREHYFKFDKEDQQRNGNVTRDRHKSVEPGADDRYLKMLPSLSFSSNSMKKVPQSDTPDYLSMESPAASNTLPRFAQTNPHYAAVCSSPIPDDVFTPTTTDTPFAFGSPPTSKRHVSTENAEYFEMKPMLDNASSQAFSNPSYSKVGLNQNYVLPQTNNNSKSSSVVNGVGVSVPDAQYQNVNSGVIV